MGKKQKGARRQILQLESKKPPQILPKQLKDLIHYSDSDDDSKKSNESDSSASVSSKKVCPLDTQVADFFKEIDALTVTEESIEPKENTLTVKNEFEKKDKCNDVSNQVVNSEAEKGTSKTESVAYCSWQEIQDESTGYSYYWNVETNEVTWDCPEEYATYVSVNSTHENVSSYQNVRKKSSEPILKKSQKKKPPRNKQEGSIIPISYFGESSSSDESCCKDKTVKKSRLKKKKSEKVGNDSKIDKQSEAFNEIIGPQLPPNFQFPTVEDSSIISTVISSDETAECVEKNLSSNQNINNCIDSKTCSKLPFNVSNGSQAPDNLDTIESSSNQTKEGNFHKEKNIANIDKETGKESPDSTVKPGIGLVLEYDSFTDEEEEVSTSNTCIKQVSSTDLSVTPRTQNQEGMKHIKSELLEEIESTKNIFAGVKRKNLEEFDAESSEIFSDKRSKKNKISSSLNIDNLFASHVSNQKHGFGFKMQEEFEVRDTTNTSDNYLNRKNGFKSVNFVKSDQILDLNDLCGSTFLETNHPLTKESLEHVQSEEQFEKEDKIYGEELDFELNKIESTTSEASHISVKEDILKSHSSENTTSLSFEEDIDEIDKALCEALEAKKAIEREPLTSGSNFPSRENPSQEVKGSNDCDIESSSDDNNSSHSKQGDPSQETYKTDILNLSSDLVDKLTFLVSNHSTLASLSTLLVQLQTRLIDWQASALESIYFMARLEEVNQYMYQYETSIVSGDWICQWDRENKRYFYTNSKTNHSQWTYPEDLKKDDTTGPSFQSSQHKAPISSDSCVVSDCDELPTVSSSSPEMPLTNKISETLKDETEDCTARTCNFPSPPPPPPGVDSPPPPPPCSPPPCSPPPPPDSTDTTCDQPEDMDLENSNDSCSHPIISNTVLYEANQIHYSSMLSCSTNHLLNNYGDNSVTSVSSTFKASSEDSSLIHRSQHTFPIVSNSCSVNNTPVLWSTPQSSCSSDILRDGLENQTSVITSVSSQSSNSVVDSRPSSGNGVQLNSSEEVVTKTNVNTTNPPVKKEKKKTKLLSVLALRKKNIPSLVEKWQKIREEQEKDHSDHT